MKEVVERLKMEGFNNIQPFDFPKEDLDALFKSVFQFISSPGAQKSIYSLLQGDDPMHFHKPYIEFQQLPVFVQNMIIKKEREQKQNRWADILENHQAKGDIVQFLSVFYNKEVLKNKFYDYWSQHKFDIVLSPVLPFTAPMHGDGVHLVNFLTLCSYQNLTDFPSGVVPVRTVRIDEISYEDEHRDNITTTLKKAIQNSEGLPACISVTSAIWKDEVCLKFMQQLQ